MHAQLHAVILEGQDAVHAMTHITLYNTTAEIEITIMSNPRINATHPHLSTFVTLIFY